MKPIIRKNREKVVRNCDDPGNSANRRGIPSSFSGHLHVLTSDQWFRRKKMSQVEHEKGFRRFSRKGGLLLIQLFYLTQPHISVREYVDGMREPCARMFE